MPPKSRAPAKLTAVQLAEHDVIDLCSSSSEEDASAADPQAPLEPLVEPPRLQPAYCVDQEAGTGPHEEGIAFVFYLCFFCCT